MNPVLKQLKGYEAAAAQMDEKAVTVVVGGVVLTVHARPLRVHNESMPRSARELSDAIQAGAARPVRLPSFVEKN